MRCKICQKEFIPNKYHLHQQVCFQPECRHFRQILNQREWRLRNPDYFKSQGQPRFWLESRRRYSRQWRIAHKEQLEAYQLRHADKRRQYMREYMRKYRAMLRRKEDSTKLFLKA